MPQLLAAAIVWAIPATGAIVAGVTIATYIATAVILVGTLALSAYQQRKAERAAHAQFDAAQVDRLSNMPATVASRELVLGRVRKGGHVFFRSSSGPFQSTFAMCIGLAAHEIDGIERYFFNEMPVDINAAGAVTTAPYGQYRNGSATESIVGNVTGLAYTPNAGADQVVVTRSKGGVAGVDNYEAPQTENVAYTLAGKTLTIDSIDVDWNYQVTYQYTEFSTCAYIRPHLGGPGQTADARLMQLFPGVWTAAHRGDGIAYLFCEFEFNETAFPSGLPNVTVLMRGAKCYEPRNGLTVFTETPAIMMRHVLMHPQFGKRTAMTAAEDARIIAAANAGDASINYGEGPLPTYRAATVIPFGAPARDALDDLSQAMGGQWAYAAGEFFLRAGTYQAPVLALTDADLAVVQRSNDGSTSQSPISISTHRPRNDKINTVVARIWDQAAGYIQTPIMPMRVGSYVADDGAELVQEVTMPAVFYARQAFHIAGIMLRDGRDPLTVTLPFKLRAYPVELFDGVTLTLARYGWAAKEFQVLGRTFLPDGVVQLTLKETAAQIFQWGAGFVADGYADNTTLPQPWNISPPTNLAVLASEDDLIVQSDGTITNGVRVTWAVVQNPAVAISGSIEVQYLVPPSTVWRSVTVPGGDTQVVLGGIADQSTVIVRIRARSSLAVSNWSDQKSVQANGKLAPPPNIIGLSISGSVISWSLPRRVPDLAGYVFRFHYGNNLDWGSATPLHTGVLTESPYDLVTRPGGVVTIMGKAIDTTGNLSLATANIVMNLGDPFIANIVEQWNFDALDWPFAAGEQSGWTIVAGDPSASALDSFYGTDEQTFYGEAFEPFYEAGAYGEMIYVSPEIVVGTALAGSIMTLAVGALGTDLRIDYRLSGPGSYYGPDEEPFYGPDDDPAYGPPGDWQPWPGQIIAANEAYQFRATIGADVTRGILQSMVVTIDAPDIEQALADVAIGSGGTAIPYTKPFTAIKTVQATLQANASGAITVEITKTVPLVPVIRAFNAAHTAVSGATADIVVKGY